MESDLRILLCFTGSVASIKFKQLIEDIKLALQSQGRVPVFKIVATNSSLKFINPQEIVEEVLTDQNEWSTWNQRGDPVLHIELRKWAQIMLICPLSANTMAKIVNGICDNLLTCVVRAWDFGIRKNENIEIDGTDGGVKLLNKPILVAPAMNTLMWENPITAKQIKKLKKMNIIVINPIEKVLMCNEKGRVRDQQYLIGTGAMQETKKIADILSQIINSSQ